MSAATKPVSLQSNSWTSASLLNFFIIVALVRLTNLNFYLSKLLGFETTIDAMGGGAFNFTNYIGVAALIVIIVSAGRSFRFYAGGAIPFVLLVIIYIVNLLITPYSNPIWSLYQILFLSISFSLYHFTRKASFDFSRRFKKGISVFFWACIGFVFFATLQILSQVSITSYFTEFNDSFVQSLDDYGIMKQRYGYLLGFILAYTIYIIRSRWLQVAILVLVLFAGIGIRSFVLGIVGATFLFTFKKKGFKFLWIIVGIVTIYLLVSGQLNALIYDTRFYSFLNAADIVQKYPFGVGLGGYPIYTEQFSRSLFADFYDVNAILDFVPTAPESDLVHLFGSLGFGFGLVHLLIIGRIVWIGYRVQNSLVPFEKCILFYFCFMTFFGISEDSIFSINYWVFFGIASGIISAALYRIKKAR